ncbi:MAG: glycosyltransferase family 2 protein [Candidatus Omnitrophica bacterium]|nr:glycosyltransferase family 2 protein [Candidatus Omnitrophota bacterium]
MNVLEIILWASFSLIGYSYIVYPAILFLLRRPTAPDVQVPDDRLPSVSIVIAAYNEEKVIRARVENLLALEYPADKLEIIIASDGFGDRTAAIAKEYASRGVVVCDYPHRRGKVNVLNETVPKAKNDIVVFSDANTAFKPDTVKMLVRRFQDKRVGSVCGRLIFTTEGTTSGELEGVYWRYETFLKTVEGQYGSLLGANGALFAIRKELFYQCPPDTIIEDFVVPMKILEKGFKCVYAPEAVAYEDAAKHIIQEKKRRIRIGAGDFQAIGLLWRMLNPLRGFSAMAFWSHKILRWFAPFFMLAAFIANILLLNIPAFKVSFMVQCCFYGLGILGQILSWAGISVKILNLFYYFISMNLALFLGFINFMTGTHNVKWERTER